MSYPKYFVSYCVMGDAAGSNMMGHACLLLSSQEHACAPFGVVDAFSYYSQPVGGEPSLSRRALGAAGMDFDIAGGYGRYQREEVRYLDRGGLTGLTFEISEEQFNEVQRLYHERAGNEQAVIDELTQELKEQGLEATGGEIFRLEKQKARSENRLPRLKPFKVDIHFSPSLDTRRSTNCKTEMLGLLQKIGISTDELAKLRPGNHAYALPRYSGEQVAPIKLTSAGFLDSHFSQRTRRYARSRKWPKQEGDEQGAKLYWLLPPESLVSRDAALKIALSMAPRPRKRIEKLLDKLQGMEFKLVKSSDSRLTEKDKEQLDRQFAHFYRMVAQSAYREDPNAVSRTFQEGYALLANSNILHQESEPNYYLRLQMWQALSHVGFVGALLMLFIAGGTMSCGLAIAGLVVGGVAIFGLFKTTAMLDPMTKSEPNLSCA